MKSAESTAKLSLDISCGAVQATSGKQIAVIIRNDIILFISLYKRGTDRVRAAYLNYFAGAVVVAAAVVSAGISTPRTS